MKINHCLPAICLLLVCATSTSLRAATITVDNTGDSGSGSLRAALASAMDGDTIDASGVSGTILLTSAELLVTNSMTIVGSGPNNLVIDGNNPTTTNRVFHIGSNTIVSISSLTITNGRSGDFRKWHRGQLRTLDKRAAEMGQVGIRATGNGSKLGQRRVCLIRRKHEWTRMSFVAAELFGGDTRTGSGHHRG